MFLTPPTSELLTTSNSAVAEESRWSNPTSSSDVQPSLGHVTGIDILLSLVFLSLPTIFHPLAGYTIRSQMSKEPLDYCLRLFPITCLLDSFFFLLEIFKIGLRKSSDQRFSLLAKEITIIGIPFRYLTKVFCTRDIRIRVIIYMIVIERYIKVSTYLVRYINASRYQDVPMSIIIATLYFVSFWVLESGYLWGLLLQRWSTRDTKSGNKWETEPLLGSNTSKTFSEDIKLMLGRFAVVLELYCCYKAVQQAVSFTLEKCHNSTDNSTCGIFRTPFTFYMSFIVAVGEFIWPLAVYSFRHGPYNESINSFYSYLFSKTVPGFSFLWQVPVAVLYTIIVFFPNFCLMTLVGMGFFISIILSTTLLLLLPYLLVYAIFRLLFVLIGVKKGFGKLTFENMVFLLLFVLTVLGCYLLMWDEEGTEKKG